MDSIFVRSLALASAPDAACVTNASRTPADGTFAIASRSESVIRVYAASCAALLHEFATIHPRVLALHYTSFSDSLVTLESDRVLGAGNSIDDEDEETFLCVYHDWRERTMVRGYTLPLGVLDTPSTKRKADNVAVCSYTGRVVVAMGSVINMWQCSQGFFEHVLEIKVDMTQTDAYHVLEFVAIHGVYVAFGSSTEVRVMEVHVHSTVDSVPGGESTPRKRNPLKPSASKLHTGCEKSKDLDFVPIDDSNCVHFAVDGDLNEFESIAIPLASYGDGDEVDYHDHHEKSAQSESEESPVVLDREEARREELDLAGLVNIHDVRVNQAMNYHIGEGDVRIILRRFLPPNQRIQTLKFLPETIDNHESLEARSYTRLLVCTVDHAFLYYFLSREADVTRKKMARKVLGRRDFKRQTSFSMRSSPTNATTDDIDSFDTHGAGVDSGRVLMHYAFSSPITSITANSSFLFATSASSLQVWSIWSPCHHLAATRNLSDVVHQEPTQPQLVSVESLPRQVSDIAALDSYVVIIPRESAFTGRNSRDLIRATTSAAIELIPRSVFEVRGDENVSNPAADVRANVFVLQQSPPSTIFSLLQSERGLKIQTRLDMLLSLYSMYRYRADVGTNSLSQTALTQQNQNADSREIVALELETRLYDRLACECAETLAGEFLSHHQRDLIRSALFFVASRMSPSKVLSKFHDLVEQDKEKREDVVQAIHRYLDARVFQSVDAESRRPRRNTTRRKTVDDGFTRSVLLHYVENAPEQLPRLIVDSCLDWTPDDIHFGFELLQSESVKDLSLVSIAHLVLTLRAQSLRSRELSEWKMKNPILHDSMMRLCSYESLCNSVDSVIQKDKAKLIRLCVNHQDLLLTRLNGSPEATPSMLSEALMSRSPGVFAEVVEAVFESSVGRRESILGTVLMCVKVMGGHVEQNGSRVSGLNHLHPHCSLSFTRAQVMLLRFTCFVLDDLPRLYSLADKDEISEDDQELAAIQRVLVMELLRLCVDFESTVAKAIADTREDLLTLLPQQRITANMPGSVPDWEIDYVRTKCIPADASPELILLSRALFERALKLIHEPKILETSEIIAVFERDCRNNNFGFLLVLLAFARSGRVIEGLRLLSEREGFVELFLPFGKHYCSTLDEWRLLIEILSSSSGKSSESESRRSDELGVLESVLHHACSTLGPEDLLQVLPDDGDLALFMATIEASAHLEHGQFKRDLAVW